MTTAAPSRPATSQSATRPGGPPESGNALKRWVDHNQFALRRLHSLTGVVFGGYIIVHLLINATLIEGARYDGEPTVYQLQVDKIHALPFLEVISWAVILLPIIYHTVYGIYIIVNGRPNTSEYPYPKNWAYLLQRISAVILIFFIAFHYLSFKGAFQGSELGQQLTFVPLDDPSTTEFSEATQSTVNHLNATWWISYLVYPIGILSATFHLANGFWTAGITWGLTITARAQRLWLSVCVGLFFLTTACGFTALIASLAQPVREMSSQRIIDPRVGEKAPDPETAEQLDAELPGSPGQGAGE